MTQLFNRREFISAAGALALDSKLNRTERRRPNVVYVIADEWRAQATGYAGDPNVQTPNLDRLASESVNVSQAISGTPVCSPYRGSLMTGQYALTSGVFLNDVPFHPKGVTLGEAFQRAGYNTGYIGKWHLYGSPGGKFERRLSYIPRENRFGFQYWKACECTHNYNHSLYYDNDDRTPKYWPGYDAVAQTADACSYIERQSKAAQPFFLVLSLGPPHFPYNTAPEPYRAAFAHKEIQLRPNVPETLRTKATENLRGYYAHIAAIDHCVGQLLQTLEESGSREDTIVVFTSDHGDLMLSQGLEKKLYPWEESLRVPFLLRYPRRLGSRGKKVDTLLNTPDIMPTLLGLSGIEIPAGVQGRDYSSTWAGHSRRSSPKSAFISLPVPFAGARSYGFAPYRGVRTNSHTYVRSLEGPWLLYDNRQDPYQKHNLCNQPASRDIQAALEHELQGWLSRLNDEFLPAEVYVQRGGYESYDEVKNAIGCVRSPWQDWRSTDPKCED